MALDAQSAAGVLLGQYDAVRYIFCQKSVFIRCESVSRKQSAVVNETTASGPPPASCMARRNVDIYAT
jgi:hypothetical protein